MTALSMGLSPVSPMVLTSQISAGWHPELLSPVFHAGGFHPGSRRLWQDHTGLTRAVQAGQTLAGCSRAGAVWWTCRPMRPCGLSLCAGPKAGGRI